MEIFIKTLTNKVFSIFISSAATIGELKDKIQDRGRVPDLRRQTVGGLIHPSRLQHSKGIPAFRLRGGNPFAEDPSLMSFGAGDSIKQTIIPDNTNHRTWDVDSAKTFHLQVVNAAHFEVLTGIIAPDTPITIEQYASLGLPFFDIYNEMPNTIYGSFGWLETVAELDSIPAKTVKLLELGIPRTKQVPVECKSAGLHVRTKRVLPTAVFLCRLTGHTASVLATTPSAPLAPATVDQSSAPDVGRKLTAL